MTTERWQTILRIMDEAYADYLTGMAVLRKRVVGDVVVAALSSHWSALGDVVVAALSSHWSADCLHHLSLLDAATVLHGLALLSTWRYARAITR